MKNFPDLPPIWTILAILAVITLNKIAPSFSYDFQNRWLATVVMVLGIGLIIWSALWFFRKKTTIEPHHMATTLLVEGPYKVSRNPIYLGMVVISVGVMIYVGNPLGLIPTICLGIILHKRFVIPEEKGLLQVFGPEAENYISKTKRWI